MLAHLGVNDDGRLNKHVDVQATDVKMCAGLLLVLAYGSACASVDCSPYKQVCKC